MMRLLFLFFIYSFLGWILETVLVTLKRKKIVNRGFLNGPLCMIYGITAVLLTVSLTSLRHDTFFLFLGSLIYATIIELLGGRLLERLYHARWWDYSDKKWNFDGYVCFSHSVFWGILGVVVIRWMNPALLRLYYVCMRMRVLFHSLMWVMLAVLVMDILGTTAVLSGKAGRERFYDKSNRLVARLTAALRKKICGSVERRILRAYPLSAESREKAEKGQTFAAGCGFYKLFWLFFVGALIGDFIETIFCRLVLKQWMSRSSLVWGPFSIVWGLGLSIFTAILYQNRERSDRFLFVIGTLLGGAFEYLCSVFTELAFGTIFWDYSNVPFNLAGRINLLYCFFWGIAAVIWFRFIYGRISGLIEKIPVKPGKVITWVLAIFMACNIAVSCLALGRYEERRRGIEATAAWQTVMDRCFDDETMHRIYPKAKDITWRGRPAEEADNY